MIWLKFAAIQLVMLIATVLGWFVLIPFCVTHAWEDASSSRNAPRIIDRWRADWLDTLYGNIEDGVSGQCALVWNKAGTARVSYMPNAHDWWRAYCWSALRNSCGGLKQIFRRTNGPFWRGEWRSWYVQLGWNSDGMPVLSAGSK